MNIALYRQKYEELKAQYKGISNANIQTSYLRLEAELLNNSSDYTFELTSLQPLSGTDTRRLLQRNNEFLALEQGFGIYEKDTADLANSKEIVYAPLTDYFTAGTLFNPEDIEWLYQIGKMSITVNNTVFMNGNQQLADFRYVPQTQIVSATGAKTQSPWNGGRRDLCLPISLKGNLDNLLKINAPTPPAGINWQQDATNKKVMMVWEFWGLEVFNALR